MMPKSANTKVRPRTKVVLVVMGEGFLFLLAEALRVSARGAFCYALVRASWVK
jgi:hypothetical protein